MANRIICKQRKNTLSIDIDTEEEYIYFYDRY